MRVMKFKLRRCTMVEYLGEKDGVERVIATVSYKDGEPVVQTDDPKVREQLHEMFYPPKEYIESWRAEEGDEETEENLKRGFPDYLRLSVDEESGIHKDIIVPQRRGDPYYLESLIGRWQAKGGMAGYKEIWAREAGKVWDEEVEL